MNRPLTLAQRRRLRALRLAEKRVRECQRVLATEPAGRIGLWRARLRDAVTAALDAAGQVRGRA
jgi:hypothetical protein